MDTFELKPVGDGFVLEANGVPVLCTALLNVAESTVSAAYDEAMLQQMHDRLRSLAVFERLRRLQSEIFAARRS